MPINTEKSHRVQVTFTKKEHARIMRAVAAAKSGGRKMTASSYIASVMREHFVLDDLFQAVGDDHDLDS